MKDGDFEVAILVKGREISEYPHRGEVFVEGREGSPYEIELRNRSGGRVEAVLSVDGLSAVDGEAAGAGSRGYVIPARGSLRVPGWKLDGERAAAFVFAGKKDSYAAAASGTTRNAGVIGVLFYVEKRRGGWAEEISEDWFRPSPWRWPERPERPRPGRPVYPHPFPYPGPRDPVVVFGAARSAAGQAVPPAASVRAAAASRPMLGGDADPGLGTGFGPSTGFRTSGTSFERGERAARLVLYYDTRQNLVKRGIPISRPPRGALDLRPDPFPAGGGGCKPPPGWRG